MALTIYKPEWGTERPIRGVLFDMDGLVLDSEKLYSRFWREACMFYGFPMTYEQSLSMRALNSKAAEATLRGFFGEGADYRTLRAKRIELMDAYVAENGVDVKPGIFTLMDHLQQQGIATAITSSSPLERIRQHLSRHGLDSRFNCLCSGHDVPNGKPAPDIYLYGLSGAEAGGMSGTGRCARRNPVGLPGRLPDGDDPRSGPTGRADHLHAVCQGRFSGRCDRSDPIIKPGTFRARFFIGKRQNLLASILFRPSPVSVN